MIKFKSSLYTVPVDPSHLIDSERKRKIANLYTADLDKAKLEYEEEKKKRKSKEDLDLIEKADALIETMAKTFANILGNNILPLESVIHIGKNEEEDQEIIGDIKETAEKLHSYVNEIKKRFLK